MLKKILIASFFLVLLFFSFWLMWHTFDYDSKNSQFLIASKLWSDFAANLPMIRSFSHGANFPPENPIFPGEPIKYHFLFYLLVGLLERSGMRVDFALNIPSALSFYALLTIIYFLAKLLFQSRKVAILSVVFFLFNGTFSFLYFFKNHPLSLLLKDLYDLKDYPSFMPYGPGEITAFWNLNVFTNQRHLALALALVLLTVYFLIKSNREEKPLSIFTVIFLGLVVGIFPSLHKAVFVMIGAILVSFFILFANIRQSIFIILIISAVIALPQLILTNQLFGTSSSISFYPGYLVAHQGIAAFIRHWVLNLGLHLLFIPLGFLLAPRQAKKVFISFFLLFLIGNLFKFSPEISANHKFFNLFIIVGNMFTAYTIIFIYKFIKGETWGVRPIFEESRLSLRTESPPIPNKIADGRPKRIAAVLFTTFLIFFLTLSGIIDFFPIKNDFRYTIADVPKNKDVLWIRNNTSPNSVFLNTSYFYHPANLAGRKIFYGWSYFTWSAGYLTDGRRNALIRFARLQNKTAICLFLKEQKIDYVALEKDIGVEELKNLDQKFWRENFLPAYQNPDTGLTIYPITNNCLFTP